jgi:hypothetical protein
VTIRPLRSALVPLALAGLLGAPPPAPAASPSQGPESFLSADLAVILEVAHPRELAAVWPRSPLGIILNDPELGSRLTRFRGTTGDSTVASPHLAIAAGIEDKVRDATGRSLADLFAGVAGPLVFVLDDFPAMVSDSAAGSSARWGVLVRGMDPALYESMGATLREKRKLATDPGRFPAWAEAGPWRILASPPSYLHELAAAAGAGSVPSPLAASDAYRTLRAEHPDADVILSVNAKGLSSALRTGVAEGLEKKPEAEAMGIHAGSVVDALGLDAVAGLSWTVRVRPEETRIDQAVTVKENRGLVSLFTYLPGPCHPPAFVPENAVLAWSNRFDVAAFYHALIGIVETVSPGIGALAETQLRQIALSAGLDLERDILGRFGPDGFGIYLRSPVGEESPSAGDIPQLSQVTGCVSPDPQALVDAVTGVMSSVVPDSTSAWSTREVGGVTMHTVGTGAGAPHPGGLSYAVAGDVVLFAAGDPAALETVLRTRARGGKGLWGRRDLAPLFASLPADASSIGYADLGALFDDPADLGPAVSSLVHTERGFASTLRILPPRR